MEDLKAFYWRGDFDSHFLGHQFEEIFKSRVYAPYLENKKDAVVLDVGANLGLFSLYASKYAKQVYAIEPSKEHYTCLTEMLKFNEISNVKPVNKAIYIEQGTFNLHHNPNKTMYSLHQAVHTDGMKPEPADTVTLEDFFNLENLDHVDLMKLDIEGTEIEVLSHISFLNVAPKIDAILTERHAWSGRNPNQLDEALKMAGFKVSPVPNDADLVIATK
jgi:FkbM family methyltransferase